MKANLLLNNPKHSLNQLQLTFKLNINTFNKDVQI